MLARLRYSLSPSKHPAGADQNDSRKRNRLSKPPTNSSSLNLSSLSLLQPGNRNSTLFPLSTSTEDLERHSPISPKDEPRELLRARIFGPDVEDQHPISQTDQKSWKGIAFTVTDLETNHSISTSPKSPVVSSLSGILNTSRLSLISSRDQKDGQERIAPKADSRISTSSREDLTAPIPIRRSSLCQPGIATRRNKNERQESSPSAGEVGVGEKRHQHPDPVLIEEALGSDLKVLNLETSILLRPVPPPLVRTETPSDLVFLGGLKLGSLHVTNGRASPAPSDLSRRVKARSTPNLRAASSDHGDAGQEEADVHFGCATEEEPLRKPHTPDVPSRFISQATRYKSPLRFSSVASLPKIKPTRMDAYSILQVHQQPEENGAPKDSPENSTSFAEQYMAEIPASPFAAVGPILTLDFLIDPTTKSTEFDDNLFEDASVSPSDSDSVDTSTLDTLYSTNDVTALQIKPASPPQKARPGYNLADSGYSPIMSLRADEEELNEKSFDETGSTVAPGAMRNTSQNQLVIPKKREDRRPGPRPLRPSILKPLGATATSLPIFQNIIHSSTTISTVMTTASTPSTYKAKKLTKLRCLSRNASREITVQGNHEILSGSIPPIPAEFTTNLAIRSRQLPELEHTYETRLYTGESPTTPNADPVDIRFPSPAKSIDELDRDSSSPPRPPNRELSFLRRSRSSKRLSISKSSHDMSEADALALIQNFGTVGHSLGDNPYDIARKNLQSKPSRNLDPTQKMNPHNIGSTAQRPKFWDGMDAETAAELARRRSRTIYERDLLRLTEKRNLFNDRGGVPGKNLRPMSFAASTPPLPPLPTSFETKQKPAWAPESTPPQLRQQNSWKSQHDQANNQQNRSYAFVGGESLVSGDHHDHRQDWEEHRSDHCQPQIDRRQSWGSDVVEIDFDHRQNWGLNVRQSENDQRQDWDPSPEGGYFKNRSRNTSHYENNDYWRRGQAASHNSQAWNEDETWEDASPIPPSHSPRPMSIAAVENESNSWSAQADAWRKRRKSAGEALGYVKDSHSYEEDRLYPDIAPRSLPSDQSHANAYAEPVVNPHHSWHESEIVPPQNFTNSQYSRSSNLHASRPHDQANSLNARYVGSLTESLHPPRDHSRMGPSPQFGRYSGGFDYGYEHGSGFGGSAGTRSVSGMAGAPRKGKELSQGYGVDLSDVPIIAGLKRI